MSGYETSFASNEDEVNKAGDFQHPSDDEDAPEAVKDAEERES